MTILDVARRVAEHAYTHVDWYFTTRVRIQIWIWSGARVGDGVATLESEFMLPKLYEASELSQRLVHSSGGLYQHGDVRVGDIVPRFNVNGIIGGHTPEELDPRVTFQTVELRRAVIYKLEGEVPGDYTLVELNTSDVTGWYLVLRRTRRTP